MLYVTIFITESATRHDYGYIYKQENSYYIDFNVQIRFKSITSATKEVSFDEKMKNRIMEYAKRLH